MNFFKNYLIKKKLKKFPKNINQETVSNAYTFTDDDRERSLERRKEKRDLEKLKVKSKEMEYYKEQLEKEIELEQLRQELQEIRGEKEKEMTNEEMLMAKLVDIFQKSQLNNTNENDSWQQKDDWDNSPVVQQVVQEPNKQGGVYDIFTEQQLQFFKNMSKEDILKAHELIKQT